MRERYKSPNVVLLDGTWTFHLASSPHDVPIGFFEASFKPDGWSNIKVPGSWELQGFGKPIYTNILFPFNIDNPAEARHLRSHKDEELLDRFLPLNPPYVPEDNPTGCYLTEFTVHANWNDRNLYQLRIRRICFLCMGKQHMRRLFAGQQVKRGV
nr:sugar-binding domain-containing protein [Paenibacillus sp. JNUCC-31]